MCKPVAVKALPGYRLWVRFDDGAEGEVDVSHLAGHGVFRLWDDPAAFESVAIGGSGELSWNDQVDLCADAIYMKLTGKLRMSCFPT